MNIELLDRVLASPELLGGIERNVEFKVIAPVLELLGWDPVTETHWGFQIARSAFQDESKRAANEADVIVGDAAGIYLVGEAKKAHDPLGLRLPQVRANQRALAAPLAFLSSGLRWMILNRAGELTTDIAATSAIQLLGELEPILGRDAVERGSWPADAWRVGLSLGRYAATGLTAELPSWDTDTHRDPVVREITQQLLAVVAEYDDVLFKDQSMRSLFIRPRNRPTAALVEFPATTSGVWSRDRPT